MKSKSEKHNHTETSTTIRIRANAFPYSCMFFCQRITDNDVIEPKDTKKEDSTKSQEPTLG